MPEHNTTHNLRFAEDDNDKARGLYVHDEEPEWWGRGLTLEVEASYTEQVNPLRPFVGAVG